MYRTFTGNTQLEVTAAIARCGTNISEAAEAIKTWIESKQAKDKTTEYILAKLEKMEKRYLVDPSIHEAFHRARALTALPRSRILPTSVHCRQSPTPSRSRSLRSRDSDDSTAQPRYSLPSTSSSLSISTRLRTVSASSAPSLVVPESPILPQALPPCVQDALPASLIIPDFSLPPPSHSSPRCIRNVSLDSLIDPESPISPISPCYPHTPITSSPLSPSCEPYIADSQHYGPSDMEPPRSMIPASPTHLSDAEKRREEHFRRDDDFWYRPPKSSPPGLAKSRASFNGALQYAGWQEVEGHF